jgi:dTMP kinase
MGQQDSNTGRFFILDGVDGCGKSTQAERLCQALESHDGRAPLHMREPGGSKLGEALRGILLSREHQIDGPVEALLFCASRAQNLREIVRPALARGQHVVCERFHASTFAYQCAGGEVTERQVLDLLDTWAGEPEPTLEILLALDVERAARRRGSAGDRIEDKGLAYQEKVACGYERYFELKRASGRVVRVPGGGGPEEVAARVWQEVLRVL